MKSAAGVLRHVWLFCESYSETPPRVFDALERVAPEAHTFVWFGLRANFLRRSCYFPSGIFCVAGTCLRKGSALVGRCQRGFVGSVQVEWHFVWCALVRLRTALGVRGRTCVGVYSGVGFVFGNASVGLPWDCARGPW